MRQQIIAGQPATRASPSSQRGQPLRGQLGAGDKKGERRVSETTINQRPPLPPTISGRSQSLNGLLDGADDADVEEGAPDVVDGRSMMAGLEARSLEVLLDEQQQQQPQEEEETVKKVQRPPRREERSKSVDNYLGDGRPFDSSPRTRSPSEKFCVNETLIVDEAMEMPSQSVVVVTEPTGEDTAYNSEEEGPLEENRQQLEKGASSTSTTPSNAMSRQNSTTSSELPERKKTFINRLGKRVKSLIKK